MGALSLPLLAAGVGLTAYGQYRGLREARDVYQYNEQLAEYQQKYIKDVADIEEAQLRRQVARTISRQRALQGKSGTVPDTGSNLDSLLKTVEEGEIDAAILRYKADAGIFSSRAEEELARTTASNFETASYVQPFATLLTGAGMFDFKRSKPTSFRKPTPATSYAGPPLSARQKRFGI